VHFCRDQGARVVLGSGGKIERTDPERGAELDDPACVDRAGEDVEQASLFRRYGEVELPQPDQRAASAGIGRGIGLARPIAPTIGVSRSGRMQIVKHAQGGGMMVERHDWMTFALRAG